VSRQRAWHLYLLPWRQMQPVTVSVGTVCRTARCHTTEVATFSNIPTEHNLMCLYMVRDCSVGTATSYALHGPVLESRWRRNFPHSFRLELGFIELPENVYRFSFWGAKRSVNGVEPLQTKVSRLQNSTAVLLDPFQNSLPAIRWTLSLLCI